MTQPQTKLLKQLKILKTKIMQFSRNSIHFKQQTKNQSTKMLKKPITVEDYCIKHMTSTVLSQSP